jgi:hypothetical protein
MEDRISGRAKPRPKIGIPDSFFLQELEGVAEYLAIDPDY